MPPAAISSPASKKSLLIRLHIYVTKLSRAFTNKFIIIILFASLIDKMIKQANYIPHHIAIAIKIYRFRIMLSPLKWLTSLGVSVDPMTKIVSGRKDEIVGWSTQCTIINLGREAHTRGKRIK
jgi:hypothetical protein